MSENKRELLLELPADIIEMADKIITYAHAKINKKLQDGAFLAMADHLVWCDFTYPRSFLYEKFPHVGH